MLCVRRRERTGFPEVVWGPGKTPLQIATIMRKLAEQDQLAVASRIEPEVILLLPMPANGQSCGRQCCTSMGQQDVPCMAVELPYC